MATVDEQTITLLSKLNNNISSEQFEQASLFLYCVDLGGEKLDEAEQILDLYHIIGGNSPNHTQDIALLQKILLIVGVKGASSLNAPEDAVKKVENLANYPALLISLCKKLGVDDYRTFKNCVCNAELGCNPDKITSRVNLMKRLAQKMKISANNVTVLIKWLEAAGRNDLASEVKHYKATAKAESDTPAQEETNQCSDKLVSLGSDVLVSLSQKVASVATEVGVSEKSLDRHIREKDLEEVAKFIQEDWQQFSWLLVEKRSPLEALQQWYESEGNKATYKMLAMNFCKDERIMYAEKVCKLSKALQFCIKEPLPSGSEMVVTTPSRPSHAQAGSVPLDYLWDTSQIATLKVFFMNPKLLSTPGRRWLCGNQVLTTETILAWTTRGWNTDNPNYATFPRIDKRPALTIAESNIRVYFGTTGECWSCIGKDAQNYQDKATMYLNLFNMRVPYQESLVLHEFGHALGLEHEHQRSDFWDILSTLIAYDENSLPGAGIEHLRSSFTEGEERIQTDYDPDSIMHYWFDVNWLKEEFRDLDKVRRMSDDVLAPAAKKVIEGVHKRDHNKGLLAEHPSTKDFIALEKAYKKIAPQNS